MKNFKQALVVFICFMLSMRSFSQSPAAAGNVMVFSNVAAYESYTNNETTWTSLRGIAQQSGTLTTKGEGFTDQQYAADTLYPDFLKEVLNQDNIFQIGNYLIKIDLFNNRGLVIAAANTNAYADLVANNLSATGMMVLDGEEDFGLEMLEGLENNTVSATNYQTFLSTERACRGAARRKDARIEEWFHTREECDQAPTIGRTYGMDNKLVYQKAIFYFSLQSKIRSIWRCTYGGTWTGAQIYYYVDTKLTGSVKYRKRCDPEVNESVDMTEAYYGGGDGELSWRAYSGGRSLSQYDFNVDFGIRQAVDRTNNPPPYYASSHYRIYWGY